MLAAALLANHATPDPSDIWERTADVVGVWAAARSTSEGRALEALYAGSPDMQTSGRSAIIRFSEADPIHVPSCMTADAIAVPVALAAATNARHYVLAVSVGSAVGVRLARAIGGVAALALGVWPALFAAPAVAAVTDAVARGLSDPLVEAALVLSLSGGSGRAGRPGGTPSGRWTTFGDATYRGLRAVRAVEAGARGDADLVSIEWLRAQTGDLASPEALAGTTRDTAFSIKTAVCARQGLTAVEGLRAMFDGVAPESIEKVEVRLAPECLGVVTRPLIAGNRLSEVANLAAALGMVAHDPQRLLDIGRESPVPQDVLQFATRVSVVTDPSLSGAPEGHWPAVLRLTGAQGLREQYFDAMPGDFGSPRRHAALREKLSGLGADGALAAHAKSSDDDPDATLARFRAAFRS